MDRFDERTDIVRDDETHATTGGAAAAGAVTGGVIGMAAGPVGAAVGAIGGAIVGAVTEGIMHSGDDYDTVGTTTMTRTWDDEMPRYRSSWQSTYGTTGGKWEDYEPHYRYGFDMRNNPNYRGRAFSDIEPDLRRDWEGRYRDTPWDSARDSIRSAWEGTDRR